MNGRKLSSANCFSLVVVGDYQVALEAGCSSQADLFAWLGPMKSANRSGMNTSQRCNSKGQGKFNGLNWLGVKSPADTQNEMIVDKEFLPFPSYTAK